MIKGIVLTVFLGVIGVSSAAQSTWNESTKVEERPLFTEHFTKQEFADRRAKVFEAIGNRGVALIQGAPMPMGFEAFRQNNEFYYLSGVESPFAYLLLDGASKETTIYVLDRNERREYNEGKMLSYQDEELIKSLSGLEHVKHVDELREDIAALGTESDLRSFYTPMSAYENLKVTRSMARRTLADRELDPMDDRPGRHFEFMAHLEELAPFVELQNLDPIIDEMRKIKSDAEIELIEWSTHRQGEAILEAMRSTTPGITASELEATSRYIFWKNGIEEEAYYALIHVGPDAFMNHYHNSERPAKPGDMILMDYGPVYEYYTSDMARMWPVNGIFNPVQRELYTFYLELYEAILTNIEIGLTPQQVYQNALSDFDKIFPSLEFTHKHHREAAIAFVDSYRERAKNPRTGLGHGVGMAVHDVGDYSKPIEPGMVFVIEPQFRIPEERVYVRLEDMIIIREDGPDVITDRYPRDMASIEAIMREEGMLQRFNVNPDLY
jgi:Xaa-Pro aminopeptidase